MKDYIKILTMCVLVPNLWAGEMKTIAFAQDDMSNDFRKAQVLEGKDAAKKYPNINYVYSDAKGQTSLLIMQIDKYINQNVNTLIIGTNDEYALNQVLAKGHEKGTNIIILDRGVQSEDYTTFINSDNIEIGKIGAEYIAKRLNGKGLVLLFEGLLKADVTKLRTKGFMDEIAKYKEIKVIKRVGNYLRRDAILEMEKLLAEGIKVDAVFAESDSMISGVRSVLQRHNIDPSSIITVGCDYTTEASDAIKAGTQTASILFPLGATQSVEVALKLMDGKKVPKHIVIPVKLVTQNNANEVKPIF